MIETKDKAKVTEEELKKVIYFINSLRGIDLCSYRQTFVFRHLRSRLLETGADSPLNYISYIKKNPEEIDLFLNALSINVTHFFRDHEVFEAFANKALPELIRRKETTERSLIRIWSAGCASGQEAYSLAILINEMLQGKENFVVRIWATDVDSTALERARKAEYDVRDLKEVNKKLLEKYFVPVYNKYTLKEEIKRMVRFERHNLITEKGFKFMDIIFCRNVMIYFSRQQQEQLFSKFYESLNSQGYLVIARVETVWDKDLFVPIDTLQKIYQKVK
jgi:chemotaxis methyl-accepting protein methylase